MFLAALLSKMLLTHALLLYLPIVFATEPSASCTAPPVQERGTAVISFSLSKNVDLEGNYYLSIHKDNQTEDTAICHKENGSDATCDPGTAVMKNHSMTLTIPRASQEDQGIYTLQMFVNNERLNTTSCTLNVQERAEHSVILSTIGYTVTQVPASSDHSPVFTTTGTEMTSIPASDSSEDNAEGSDSTVAVAVSVVISFVFVLIIILILWKCPDIRRRIYNQCCQCVGETDNNNGSDPAPSQPMLMTERDLSNNPRGAESNSNLPGREVNPGSRDHALSGRLTPIGQSCLDDEEEEAGETTGVDGPRPIACRKDGQPTPAPPQTFYGDDEGEPFELLTADARTGSSENDAGGSYSWGCSFQ